MTLAEIFYLVGIIFFSVFTIGVLIIVVLFYRIQMFIRTRIWDVQRHVIAFTSKNIGFVQAGLSSLILRKLGNIFTKRR